jgi:hypothetical protein
MQRSVPASAPDACAILGAALSASMMRALSPPDAIARSGRSGSAGPAASSSSTRSRPASLTQYACQASSPARAAALSGHALYPMSQKCQFERTCQSGTH